MFYAKKMPATIRGQNYLTKADLQEIMSHSERKVWNLVRQMLEAEIVADTCISLAACSCFCSGETAVGRILA